MGARPSALSLGRAWTGNISHFSTHSRVLEGTPRQDGPESYQSHCFHHRHQTNKQASKRKTKHMVSLMMFKASIYSNQFSRLLSSLSLSLSLSRCLFFLFRRLPADFADGVRPPLEFECSKVRFRRFLRHLVELTIQCVNNECIRSILRLHKRATQVMGQIMLPKQIYWR